MSGATTSHGRLTPVSIVVLGFVERNGEITSYDLKARVEGSVGYFWPFPHTQLYDEPKRLASLGLLAVRQEDSGRRRRLYSITDVGRAALVGWVEEPVHGVTRIQDTALLQLFFAATASSDPEQVQRRVRAVAHAQIDAHTRRLAEYDQIEQAINSRTEMATIQTGGCVHRTLTAGRQVEQTMIDFWHDVLQSPPTAP
jgi:PadR family transcriptional regulator AphA